MDLVLSIFPGIDLLGRAFEEEGFCVVRGPDLLWGGDVSTFHPPPGRFDGVIGGPPCYAFSRLRYLVEHNGYKVAENLIPEFERCVAEAQPVWFLMENVPAAPRAAAPSYSVWEGMLNNRHFGGVQNRERRFSFGVRGSETVNLWRYLEMEALQPAEWEYAVCASGNQRIPVKIGGSGKVKARAAECGYINRRMLPQTLRLQGLPEDFFEHSPFTVAAQQKMLGNGVPLMLGRAVARAIRIATFKEDT